MMKFGRNGAILAALLSVSADCSSTRPNLSEPVVSMPARAEPGVADESVPTADSSPLVEAPPGPRKLSSAVRGVSKRSDLPCFYQGRRLARSQIAPADPRCTVTVNIHLDGLVAVTQPDLSGHLEHHASKLKRCYLLTYHGATELPWIVIPVWLTLPKSGSKPTVRLDAKAGTDQERRLLTCVREQITHWVLPQPKSQLELGFGLVLDPGRGVQPRKVPFRRKRRKALAAN